MKVFTLALVLGSTSVFAVPDIGPDDLLSDLPVDSTLRLKATTDALPHTLYTHLVQDGDEDGVRNESDYCPTTPASKKVWLKAEEGLPSDRHTGCATDGSETPSALALAAPRCNISYEKHTKVRRFSKNLVLKVTESAKADDWSTLKLETPEGAKFGIECYAFIPGNTFGYTAIRHVSSYFEVTPAEPEIVK